jgi:NADPH2:quinone reductase|tara:strand:+ start:2491 stop:3495 length:1005 start_codon:yes stop_codon:yes gene_type:complete
MGLCPQCNLIRGGTVKAVYCERFGGLETLSVREVDAPADPEDSEVIISIKARGVSFSDLVMMAGEYQDKREPPFIVGGEGTGVITAVGREVTELEVGDRVLCSGGCVEAIRTRADAVTRIPDGVDFDAAASFRSNYATALYGLQQAALQPGETLLVHGAAGGVGLAAVDVGKLFGATVIGTAGSAEKLAIVSWMGGDHIIDYRDGFADEVKVLTGGLGADVIYDPVGGDVFDESMHCIAPFGRILVVGFTSGRPGLAKTNHLLVKDVSVIGFSLGGLAKYRPRQSARNARVLLDWLAHDRIRPYISHRLPLEKTVEALQLIKDRKVTGKVVVTS